MQNLLTKKLIFLTGKGGVGKSTISAALANLAASQGKRVLVCELDADSSMERIFGAMKIGYKPTEVAKGTWCVNINATEAIQHFVRRSLPIGRIANIILRNKVAKILFESAPSVIEAVILDQVGAYVTSEKDPFDLVIVDLPSSGHALTWMNVPKSMASAFRVGEMANRLQTLADLIASPEKSALVVVCLPEEIPINETIELHQKLLDQVDTPISAIIVNCIRASGVEPKDAKWVRSIEKNSPDHLQANLSSIAHGLELGGFWNSDEREHINRLRKHIKANFFEVPFFFDKIHEQQLVQRVAESLGRKSSVEKEKSS